MDLLERKLSVLRQQKQLLQQEITDNNELGLKVSISIITQCFLSVLFSSCSDNNGLF